MAIPTAAQVVAEANNARQQLATLEQQLQAGIDDIDFTAFQQGRQMTSAETDKRRKLRATQAEVREQFKVLAFVTAQRLDQTEEVSALLRQIQAINSGLKDDLARLKKIERYAATAAKVADAIAKATEKLAAIAAKGFS
jgi:chromosome segregation ATPase